MPQLRKGRRAGLAGLLIALAAAAAAVPSTASAAFTCEASALRGAILTAPAIEPTTANRGQALCRPAKGGLADVTGALPLPLSLGAAAAQTTFEGSNAQPGSQVAGAIGGLLDARVKPLGLPQIPIPVNQVPTVTVPLAPLPTLPGVPAPPNVTVDLKPALQALVGQVTADVLRIQTAVSFASARCVDGRPQLAGSSRLAGLTVLGLELPTDKATEQSLEVLDTQSVDPSNIDVSKIPLPPGVAPELLPYIQQAVKPLLDALPTISIPATLATVKVTPNQTLREGDRLVQRALQLQITLLGQRLADVMVGEAIASATNVNCSAPANEVAQEQLACTKRRLALVDVLRRGGRVKLFGVADRSLIGKRVSIRFTATGRQVARPVVRRNGEFSATAPLPPASIRNTNRARYRAVLGRERSLGLKLMRRMVVTRLTSSNGRVTIAGRVIRPLGKPIRTIVVTRRVSCRRTEVVRRIKPSRTGAFRVTVAAPPRTLAATYRLSTRVRKFARNPKLFPTYTLPRAVEILE